MQILRTRFKKDIVCEFLPPSRKSQRVIILAGGMPSAPSKKEFMKFWAKKGFWVFYPRYRGSWESGGEFLAQEPTQDILDVLDEIPKGFISFWDNKKFKVEPSKVFIFGSSFGGPAAILASRDRRVDKVVAISPVIDWTARSIERSDRMYEFLRKGFGEAFRFKKSNWLNLYKGKFYNPIDHIDELNGEKLFIVQAEDDKVVIPGPVKKFAKKLGCKFKLYKTGGHLGMSFLQKPAIYRQVQRFLKGR